MEDRESLRREYLFKELDLVQDIIKRLAHNSFLIKGWAITLVVVTLLFKSQEKQGLIALVAVAVFWCLDAYYLWHERAYRLQHEWLAENRGSSDEHLLSMDSSRFRGGLKAYLKSVLSGPLIILYGAIAALVVLYTFIAASSAQGAV